MEVAEVIAAKWGAYWEEFFKSESPPRSSPAYSNPLDRILVPCVCQFRHSGNGGRSGETLAVGVEVAVVSRHKQLGTKLFVPQV